MTSAALRSVSLLTLLRLGRVSNLPTVWTNVLTGAVLAGADWRDWRVAVVVVAMSLFYVGGMYLNDYFDRAIDARERPGRPIPAGEIAAAAVAVGGFGLLVAAVLIMAAMGPAAGALALLLGCAIIGYDRYHKDRPLAPLLMAACRALVYCGAAAALNGAMPLMAAAAALAMGAYVAGLTYAARQESLDRVGNLWPLLLLAAPILLLLPFGALQQGPAAAAIALLAAAWIAAAVYLLARRPVAGAVPRAVGWLIAGISLCDAALMAGIGAVGPALLGIAGFGCTLFAQKYIAGT